MTSFAWRKLLRLWRVFAYRWLVVSLAVLLESGGLAEDTVDWKTGDDFRSQLNSTIGFQWESNPIRQGLQGLSRNQRIAIWLDRRVDPDYEVDLAVRDATLDEALQRVGSRIGGGVSYVGSVAFLGSQSVTEKLATLAALRRDEVKRLPTSARTRFSTSSTWSWESLATPRELLSELVRSADATVVNIDQLPHDLWPANDLPSMPLTDRVTLLLAGFDLTFEIAEDGSSIRLMPMPATVAIQRTYASNGSLNTRASKIATAFPGVSIERQGARLAVTATFEQHEAIGRLLRGKSDHAVERPAVGLRRFDLRVQNQTIDAIVSAIAAREMLEVRVDPAIQSNLQQRISLDVKQLTLRELLDRALEAGGIAHRIQGGVLELRSP